MKREVPATSSHEALGSRDLSVLSWRGAPWPVRLLIAGRLVLGLVFVYAAYTKLRAPWLQFAGSIDAYKILSPDAVEFVARTLPWLELTLGILLVSGVLLRFAALAVTVLLAAFFFLMVRSYALGMQIDCGCFGVGEALGPKTLIRDGLLLGLAGAVTFGAFRLKPNRRRAVQEHSSDTTRPAS